MEATLSLQRPVNWQDFEKLCKKLWGEIWKCPEIVHNGRGGQQQHGVDIYGIPAGETVYYGIQCKGKSEYQSQQFTEKEISDEIEKAKLFQPPLGKLYFATTAVRDVQIQQFIRMKNMENISKGLFEVHLFSWEDIVDLINENKLTHDWYIKNQNYKTIRSVSVTFENDKSEICCEPKFKKLVTSLSPVPREINDLYNHPSLVRLREIQNRFDNYVVLNDPSFFAPQINKSFFGFRLKITNSGIEPIEEYKVLLNFEGEIVELADTNKVKNYGLISPFVQEKSVYLDTPTLKGEIIPHKKILVGDDFFLSDTIYIKTKPVSNLISIKWKLISKNLRDTGSLSIQVNPYIDQFTKNIVINDDFIVELENEIEDFIGDAINE